METAEDSGIRQTWFKLCDVGQITSHFWAVVFQLQLRVTLLCRIAMRLNAMNAYKVLRMCPALSKYLINAVVIILINKLSLRALPAQTFLGFYGCKI